MFNSILCTCFCLDLNYVPSLLIKCISFFSNNSLLQWNLCITVTIGNWSFGCYIGVVFIEGFQFKVSNLRDM